MALSDNQIADLAIATLAAYECSLDARSEKVKRAGSMCSRIACIRIAKESA